MIQENIYYVPEIEEFCVGFEYETYSVTTVKCKEVTRNWQINIFKENHKIYNGSTVLIPSNTRVKFLDKEDIEEALDTKQLKGNETELNFQILIDDSEDFYDFDYDLEEKVLVVEIFRENTLGSHNCYTLFHGVIKNKSELKKLLQQLNIK